MTSRDSWTYVGIMLARVDGGTGHCIIVELREEESSDILTRIVQRLTYYIYMTCTVMKPYKPYT